MNSPSVSTDICHLSNLNPPSYPDDPLVQSRTTSAAVNRAYLPASRGQSGL